MHDSKAKSTYMQMMYIAGWLFFLYLFVSIIRFNHQSQNILVGGMYFLNFGVHEVSHLLTVFLPPLVTASAGSLGEICFASLILLATIRAKAYFASVFAGLWIMLSFVSAGLYMSDARSQSITLMGPGEYLIHDWNFIFTQLGLLESDVLIGGIARWIGIIIGAGALIFGLYVVIDKIMTDKA